VTPFQQAEKMSPEERGRICFVWCEPFQRRQDVYPHINFRSKFTVTDEMGQRGLPVQDVLSVLEPILQVGPAKDLEGSLTDVCLLLESTAPVLMSLLNGISYVINASKEARKCFGDFILDFVKRSWQ
jgi:hypothetical protein